MAYRFLYLVRHAQFNPDENTNPRGDLTALGRRQARRVVQALKGLPITTIHASAAARAMQTAAPLVAAFPDAKVSYTRRLLECIPPLSASMRQAFFSHVAEDELASHYAHAERAYTRYFRRATGADKHEVMISHGNLIRYLVCRALNVDPTAWGLMASRNCGLTRIVVEPNGMCVLLSYNEVGHLPAELRTDNLYLFEAALQPEGE